MGGQRFVMSSAWGCSKYDYSKHMTPPPIPRSATYKNPDLWLVTLAAFCMGMAITPLVIVALRYVP
jgi:hypothetical protein